MGLLLGRAGSSSSGRGILDLGFAHGIPRGCLQRVCCDGHPRLFPSGRDEVVLGARAGDGVRRDRRQRAEADRVPDPDDDRGVLAGGRGLAEVQGGAVIVADVPGDAEGWLHGGLCGVALPRGPRLAPDGPHPVVLGRPRAALPVREVRAAGRRRRRGAHRLGACGGRTTGRPQGRVQRLLDALPPRRAGWQLGRLHALFAGGRARPHEAALAELGRSIHQARISGRAVFAPQQCEDGLIDVDLQARDLSASRR
mmetsp:Transcript_118405/g.377428  ORF Transcript_118405/g.377428 Transcript_118405/m.377428 type:complete len:254 (+) Transcript_118405:261-1022(+)